MHDEEDGEISWHLFQSAIHNPFNRRSLGRKDRAYRYRAVNNTASDISPPSSHQSDCGRRLPSPKSAGWADRSVTRRNLWESKEGQTNHITGYITQRRQRNLSVVAKPPFLARRRQSHNNAIHIPLSSPFLVSIPVTRDIKTISTLSLFRRSVLPYHITAQERPLPPIAPRSHQHPAA